MNLDLADVVERLALSSILKRVGGAADFAAAQNDLKGKMPAAYVLPLSASAGPNLYATTAMEQSLSEEFAVILAVQNLRDARGEASLGNLRTARQAVLGQLLGWTPDAATFDLFEFSGGRLLALEDAVMWWQDQYRTRSLIRAV